MIIENTEAPQQKVFEAVRTTVQEIHPESVFAEDSCGSPFLFKSTDAKVWVRIFYRAMGESDLMELGKELAKLKVLTPKDARICFFYPMLDSQQLHKFRAAGDQVVFFEYGELLDENAPKTGIRVRRWAPASTPFPNSIPDKSSLIRRKTHTHFLDYSKLSPDEVAGLTELGLNLKRL